MPLTYRSQSLSGWGRYAASRADVARPERRHEIADVFSQVTRTSNGVIARGGGLAYGDAASNDGGRVLAMGRLDRFLAFDVSQGLVSCEAGVTVGEIIDACAHKGWFPYVTPGTARATVGGCLACDVHGKNHHAVGSFGQHVVSATLLTATGDLLTCGPDREPALFWATCGGMGLTGILLELTIQLQRIETDSIVARNLVTRDLDETFRRIDETADATYSVAWLDGANHRSGLGRGIVMLGEHARVSDLPDQRRAAPFAKKARQSRSVPCGLPVAILGSARVVDFLNDAIYGRYAKAGESSTLVDTNAYFFPLDTLDNWNRLLGPRGFFEYQVVLPPQQAFDTIRRMLELLREQRLASFFTSVKRLGPDSPGHLSFPAPGYAFSFDVPALGANVLSLLDRCDELTIAAGGRVYLAKDARLRAGAFAAMYPRRDEWRSIVRRYDPAGVLASSMSRRLELTE